jgi:hypothetical protein
MSIPFALIFIGAPSGGYAGPQYSGNPRSDAVMLHCSSPENLLLKSPGAALYAPVLAGLVPVKFIHPLFGKSIR